ncbi:MAG: hypothetical protein QOI39_4456, partial [Mycobacterium sp.]|nr:hypothetical protein [Mycobacterium sp.]
MIINMASGGQISWASYWSFSTFAWASGRPLSGRSALGSVGR